MALVSIPTFSDQYYREISTLDGSEYILDFAFNAREQCWYFSLYDVNENALCLGIKIVCNISLAFWYDSAEGMPPGDFFCSSSTTDDSPPNQFELGTGLRCNFYYLETGTPTGSQVT